MYMYNYFVSIHVYVYVSVHVYIHMNILGKCMFSYKRLWIVAYELTSPSLHKLPMYEWKNEVSVEVYYSLEVIRAFSGLAKCSAFLQDA